MRECTEKAYKLSLNKEGTTVTPDVQVAVPARADEVAGRRHVHGRHRRLLRAARRDQKRGQSADRERGGRPHPGTGRTQARGRNRGAEMSRTEDSVATGNVRGRMCRIYYLYINL